MSGKKIYFMYCCCDNNYIWFVHQKINALMRIGMTDKHVEYIANFPIDYANGANFYFGAMVDYEERIFFIPNLYNSILVFNKATREFENVELLDNYKKNAYGMFRYGYKSDNCIICIPSGFSKIISFDINSFDYTVLLNWKELKKEYEVSHISDFAYNSKTIALLVKPSNEVILFNIATQEIKIISPYGPEGLITSIEILNENIYLYNELDKSIGIINVGNLKKEKICTEFDDVCYLYRINDYFLMVDLIYREQAAIIDEYGKVVWKYGDNLKLEEYSYFHIGYNPNDAVELIYYNNVSNELIYINLDEMKHTSIPVFCENKEFESVKRIKAKCLCEDEYITLNDFISSIVK